MMEIKLKLEADHWSSSFKREWRREVTFFFLTLDSNVIGGEVAERVVSAENERTICLN